MYQNAICIFCNKTFKALTKELKRGKAKYCSKTCVRNKVNTDKKNKVLLRPHNCNCAVCNKSFYKSEHRLNRGKTGFSFCSRKCKDTAQSINGITEYMPKHYNTSNNYRNKALRYYENKCNRCHYNVNTKILVVHHKNRDRNDNNFDNLEILCPNCHAIEHITKSRRRIERPLGDLQSP